MSGFMEEYGMHVLDVLDSIPSRILDFQDDEEKMKKVRERKNLLSLFFQKYF